MPSEGASGAPHFSPSPQQTLGLGQGSPVPTGSAAYAGRLPVQAGLGQAPLENGKPLWFAGGWGLIPSVFVP